MSTDLDGENKRCPRCGIAFVCQASVIARCQCRAIILTAEQKAFVKQRYMGCLCVACLQSMADECKR
ncbi:MAG: cysteine-rich CWC family protein [Ectothiorhodospiraceae bacterium]|nr:cysteine-rich CWC family protein [Ectothiorhodospiraceae bacterium]